jgi:23S rRNA pseudouridine2605 synthase
MEEENIPGEGEGARANDGRMRLAKLIAQRGVASRRAAEQLIRDGDVVVNGNRITDPATTVDPERDHVRVEGRALPAEAPKAYYVMYKPRGVITGKDEESGRASIYDTLEERNLKVDPVGRLDFNSEGALLLTNDGELAHALTHPSRQVPKRWVAKVYRTPSDKDLKAIERGVVFEGGRAKPAKARVLSQTETDNAWVEITVTESGPRVVQRIFTQLGHPVSKLRRESFATVSIRGMERGQIRPLTGEEIARLRDIAEGVDPRRAGRSWRKPGFAKPRAPRRQKKGDQG